MSKEQTVDVGGSGEPYFKSLLRKKTLFVASFVDGGYEY